MRSNGTAFLSLLVLVLCCAWLPVSPASATVLEQITDVEIDGNVVTARLELTSEIGADLTLTFEDVVGLSEANLGWSIDFIDGTEAVALLARMPSSLVTLPGGLPLLLTLEPPATGGLSFSGVAHVELYTHDLMYTAFTPLRLFAAPVGGDFVDVTTHLSSGSYRARGTRGSFSEFVVVADARPVATVIDVKFIRLDGLLTTFSSQIEDTVEAKLIRFLDDAETLYRAGNVVGAIQKIEVFATTVEQASSAEIPDVWRSSRDLTNVAGGLRAAAETLRFSLVLASIGAP